MRILFAAMFSMAGATSVPLRDTANLKAGLEALQQLSDSLKGTKDQAPEALFETEATTARASKAFDYVASSPAVGEEAVSVYCGSCAGWAPVSLSSDVRESFGMPKELSCGTKNQNWWYTWDYEVNHVTNAADGKFLYACDENKDQVIDASDKVLWLLDFRPGYVGERKVEFNFELAGWEGWSDQNSKLFWELSAKGHQQRTSVTYDKLGFGDELQPEPQLAYAWSQVPIPGAYVYFGAASGKILKVLKMVAP